MFDNLLSIAREMAERPQVLLRVAQWLVCVVVFASIADKCRPRVCLLPEFSDDPNDPACTSTAEYCVYNGGGACSYAVGVGVFSFLLTIAFIASELFGLARTNRRLFSLVDLGLSTLIAILWFLGFCWLSLAWIKEPHEFAVRVVNNAQGAIVFALFSTVLWVYGSLQTFNKIDEGDAAFIQSYSPFSGGSGSTGTGSAYTPYQSTETGGADGNTFANSAAFNPQSYSVSSSTYEDQAYSPLAGTENTK
eukprot:CFRG4139T1